MRVPGVFSLFVALSLSVTACGASTNESSKASGGGICATTKASGDVLADVCKAGTLKAVAYPGSKPRSFFDDATGKWDGYDIDIANEIAAKLGVNITYQSPSWDVMTAGGWNGRWDMGGGSMTITTQRQQVLHFTKPYYYISMVALVPANSPVKDLSTDLDGAKIGVPSGSTYEKYLNKELTIAGFDGKYLIDDAKVQGYDDVPPEVDDLVIGRLDAVLIDGPTAQSLIDSGKPLKIVGQPLTFEPIGIAFDKKSSLDSTSLYEAVDGILDGMHQDGTLSQLSKKWFGSDLTVKG